MHTLANPNRFLKLAERIRPWAVGICIIAFFVGIPTALVFSPPDYQQGNTVRIMYIHVPAAILAQSGYVMMAVAAIVFLVWRIKLADMAIQAIAPLGASITFLALVTGAIWGKPTWGTWWVWDSRLTSTLVLFFLYVGVMALRAAIERQNNAGRACAILAVVGVVNLPIIKYSVEWWYTLHQPASFSLTEKPAMPTEMWLPLLVMVIAYYLFFFTVWFARLRNEILDREREADWVKSWVMFR